MFHVIRLLLLLCLPAANTLAGDFHFESGVRYGLSYSADRHDEFHAGEIFGNWNLPWQWRLAANWTLQPQATASLGWLQQRYGGGFMGSLGPDLVFRRRDFPVVFVGGFGLTGLGRSNYEAHDFGSPVLFNEHAGLNWELTRRFFIGYRFQHMSNASLNIHNPGLNLHMLTAGFRF